MPKYKALREFPPTDGNSYAKPGDILEMTAQDAVHWLTMEFPCVEPYTDPAEPTDAAGTDDTDQAEDGSEPTVVHRRKRPSL